MATRIFLFLILAVLTGCYSTSTDTGPERLAPAFINNSSRFADGCDVFVTLVSGSSATVGKQYKPSPATLPIVQNILADFPDSTRLPVVIRFIETGSQVKIVCGWYSPTVPEIRILALIRR